MVSNDHDDRDAQFGRRRGRVGQRRARSLGLVPSRALSHSSTSHHRAQARARGESPPGGVAAGQVSLDGGVFSPRVQWRRAVGVTQGGAGAFGIFFDNHHRRVARVQVSDVSARVAHGAVRGVGAVRNVVFRGRAGVVRRFSVVPGRGHGAGDTRVLLWAKRYVVVRHLARRVRGVVSHRSHIRGGVFLFSQV